MIKIDFLSTNNRKKYEQNDIGTSRLFIDSFSDEIVYCADAGEWFVWNGKHWERDICLHRNELIKNLYDYCISHIFSLRQLDQKEQSELLKYYCKLSDKNYRDKIMKDAMSVNPIPSKIFDSHKFLFNCQNGTYDFKKNKFRDFNKNDYLTDISNVTYNPDAECPMFEKYLYEVMENDLTKIDYIMKIAAYCLTGDTSRECFFVFYGDKTRNGKGTFVSTYTYLAGTYSQTLNPASITKKQTNNGGSSASPDLAKLKGARIASVNELEDGMVLDIALMKSLTGGDTMTARFLYKEEFEFAPQFKVIINTNVLPRMSDDTIFKSDRIHLLCFDRHFELAERDMMLKDKLRSEISGIFNILILAYQKLLKEGFIFPESTRKTIEQYQLNSNNVMAFTEDVLYENASSYERTADIYKKYTDWIDENGLKPLAKKTFRAKFEQLGAMYFDKSSHKNDAGKSDNTTWYKGFSLTKPKTETIEQLKMTETEDNLPF